MKPSRLPKALRSIHTRLLLVIAVSGLIINLVVLLGFFAHRSMAVDAFRRNIAQYVFYLAKEIGSPPDQERATEIAGRTGMDIYYVAPERDWSTSGHPLPVSPDRLRIVYEQGSVSIGFRHRHHYLIYREGDDSRLFFEVIHDPLGEHQIPWVGPVLVMVVTVLLVGAYYWIRHIMAPLKQLSRGVEELSLGRLDHRVAVDRGDELGDLARAFNTMGERLGQLIRTKEQMLRDVSHELRSPLTRMKVALEMAPAGALRDSLHEDVLDMERMVAVILESARTQSGAVPFRLERADLIALIGEEVRSREHQPPGVELEPMPESVWLLIDSDKVRTALRNVLDNAFKYSRSDSGPIKMRVVAETGTVTVEIEDQGIGIPEDDLPFIFEPFYRVDRSRSRDTGGFGLGLSLCKAIMDAHGGSIRVDSRVGQGTRVTLRFPVGGTEAG